MARSAKTNHVLSLVGERGKADHSPQKDEHSSKAYNPALLPIEEELRSGKRNVSPLALSLISGEAEAGEKEAFADSEHGAEAAEEAAAAEPKPDLSTNNSEQEQVPNQNGDISEKYEQPAEKYRKGITAVVPELVNQELEAIVERFNIDPTDRNLWQLTKAALESIRPEFSLNGEQYAEKCNKLRQRVILEMTKAAIRISKASRGGN